MNWEELVSNKIPSFLRLVETPIFSQAKNIIGWHCIAEVERYGSFAGGTHKLRDTARRIAIAELLERACVLKLRSGKRASEFLFDDYPTSSGCAAGFDDQRTRFRSIAEGLERWAWSQWIDKQVGMSEAKVQIDALSPLAQHFYAMFEDVKFFAAKISGLNFEGLPKTLQFSVAVGFSEKGAFPGSRVTTFDDDPWTHALIESYRHLDISKRFTPTTDEQKASSWYFDRVLFFAENRYHAEKQMVIDEQRNFPVPELLFHSVLPSEFPQPFAIYRTLFSDFLSWDLGSKERFVY